MRRAETAEKRKGEEKTKRKEGRRCIREGRGKTKRQVHSKMTYWGFRSSRRSMGGNRGTVVQIYCQKAARRREIRRIQNNWEERLRGEEQRAGMQLLPPALEEKRTLSYKLMTLGVKY